MDADAVIVATIGGLSYPSTGSTETVTNGRKRRSYCDRVIIVACAI